MSPLKTIEAQCMTIYQAYPKHIKRKLALPKIKTALREKISYDDLLEAVVAYAISQKGNNPQFIPAMAVWLNGEQWDDDRIEWTRWKSVGSDGASGPIAPPAGKYDRFDEAES